MRYKILDQHGLNFITLTIVEWIDLFTRPVYSEILLDSLKFCQDNKGLQVHAYIIMPSHVHLIVSTDGTNELSAILQSFKSYTAKQFLQYIKDPTKPESRREWLLNHFKFNARKNRTNSEHQVWQRDNHPIILYSPRVIRQKLMYIHFNPVDARMVTSPEHYIFSSASNYTSGKGVFDVVLLDGIWDDTGYIPTFY